MMIKIIVKNIFQWVIALIIGFMIVNALCYIYDRPVGWIDTDNGVSRGIRNPGAYCINCNEGYAVSVIDRYGYTNEDKPLGDSYVLVMGASHTQGKEVSINSRYSFLLDHAITSDTASLSVFNIAADANFLPYLIKYFYSAVTAYPNSYTVVLEIGNTDYSAQEINESCSQAKFNPSETAELFSNLDMKDKTKLFIKETNPLLSKIKSQIETYKSKSDSNKKSIDMSEYLSAINRALSLIRSEYDGNIVFLYHPETDINADGSLKLKYSSTYSIFQQECERNNIDIIDLGSAFEKEYNSSYQLPYGFSNTTPGNGHLNEVGHSLAAAKLIEYLEEKRK